VKLLYLSCHEVLEFDELVLFRELGIDVFSIGAYLTPNQSTARLRPSLPEWSVDVDDWAAFEALPPSPGDRQECLTREFVDRFDAVLVMHIPRWIMRNWDVIRHKTVIWRTIGQSVPQQELVMRAFREDGLRIVRYSPAERSLRDYAGEDAMIRFGKDPAEWTGWTGVRPQVVCFAQAMPRRALECNYQAFVHATRGLPCELFGPGNEAAGDVWRGCLSYDGLRAVLRQNRVCLFTGTFPASYTLGFLEAWMTGIPIVAIGRRLFGQAGPELSALYEVPDLIEHGESGFVSDDCDELRGHLERLLNDWEYAQSVSEAGRAAAVRYFDKAVAREKWRDFFRAFVGL